MDLENELTKFGLSSKEAKIYLTLLSSGRGIVSDISKQAKINRSTAYVLLESLIQKGLVSISEDSLIKIYNAVSPERLLLFLENNAKKYLELVGIAKSLLPQLKATYSGVGPKPKIEFFEGIEGIRSAYEATLESSETIKAYASIENMHDALSDYFPAYYYRRAAKKIHIQSIFPDSPAARERVKHNKGEARSAHLLPIKEYGFTPEINIYDNKIVFFSFVEKFALTIESAELADAMKKIFKLAWAQAKRLSSRSKKRQ